ncbi:MAG: lysozyme [Alphaproteobacteria bacterium]
MSSFFKNNRSGAGPYSISAKGLALVKEFEGLYLDAYLDPVGIWTIGYGNTGPEAYQGNKISRRRADELLAQDMFEFEQAVLSLVRVPLNPNQFDALVSFAFNVGEYGLQKSTLLRLLNSGNYAGAAKEFHRWNKGTIGGEKVVLRGLTRRRAAEANLFLSPTLPRRNINDSRTVKAGKVAAGATTCAALTEVVRSLEPVSPLLNTITQTAPTVLIALIGAGLFWMLWARYDDHRKGLR